MSDPVAAVTPLAELGIARILTSGGASQAGDGAATLARMVAAGEGRVEITAGGRLTADDVPAVAATGAAATEIGVYAFMPKLVIAGFFIGIGEHFVRFVGLLKFFLG